MGFSLFRSRTFFGAALGLWSILLIFSFRYDFQALRTSSSLESSKFSSSKVGFSSTEVKPSRPELSCLVRVFFFFLSPWEWLCSFLGPFLLFSLSLVGDELTRAMRSGNVPGCTFPLRADPLFLVFASMISMVLPRSPATWGLTLPFFLELSKFVSSIDLRVSSATLGSFGFLRASWMYLSMIFLSSTGSLRTLYIWRTLRLE
mmetsp:Transcript_14973/g.23169  ORF Transcript_14973/g.23169 Transcript_14973/m.23169 type:complete len:203 (-) Transcript_14973:7558-8166(-)